MPDQWRTVLINGKWHVTDGAMLMVVRHGYLAANGVCDILNTNQCEVIYPDSIPLNQKEADCGSIYPDELRKHFQEQYELDQL